MIKIYSQFLVAGLFQTEDHARHVLRSGKRANKVDALVANRMVRQEVFDREDPPGVSVLLEENAIRKAAGGRETMKTSSSEEGASGQGNLTGAGPRVTNLRVEFDMIASMALSGTESEECVRGILESM
ncbi:Scr1 family TA system antitoxin-like transcriptional regulator [Actinocorallia libanotica]|uniref:DUF5753 domain-containing protein n=1 Tax=Actinocorallia libanotica TaxID=46162 RepID=A0ABP4BYP7_9ACTN